jgi:dihydrofolate synthase/folylpolyglutamate synthase
MTYPEAVNWLFSRFPAYQLLGATAYKPDLQNVHVLLKALGNPQDSLTCIHVAGTNGKGSTSHILAALFQSQGLKTGIFTSPHLVDFRERIKVNGEKIAEHKVVAWVNEVIPSLFFGYDASFFELTFALALDHFNEQGCDVCIIETGLGGRLDATNIINPKLCVITNIGYDHQFFLGSSRQEIATEKAGIIKPFTPVLIAEKDESTTNVFKNKVDKENALLRWVDFSVRIESDLQGDYQQLNLNTALQAFRWFCEFEELAIDHDLVTFALNNVARLTDFHGRMELIQTSPTIIFDVAHNISGIKVLLRELKNYNFQTLHLVFGTSNDKDLSDILTVLPPDACYYLCEFHNPRSRKMVEWQQIGQSNFENFAVFDSPTAGLTKAKFQANENDLILVFGSFFLIGELF